MNKQQKECAKKLAMESKQALHDGQSNNTPPPKIKIRSETPVKMSNKDISPITEASKIKVRSLAVELDNWSASKITCPLCEHSCLHILLRKHLCLAHDHLSLEDIDFTFGFAIKAAAKAMVRSPSYLDQKSVSKMTGSDNIQSKKNEAVAMEKHESIEVLEMSNDSMTNDIKSTHSGSKQTQDGLNNGAGNLVSAKVTEHKVSNQKKQTSVTDFFRKLPTRKSL